MTMMALYEHNYMRVIYVYQTGRICLSNVLAASNKWSVDPNILMAIVGVEYINRSYSVELIEKVLVKLIPKVVVKLDLSIGIAQIRVSTVRSIDCTTSDVEVVKKLMKEESAIDYAARLISLLRSKHNNKRLSEIEIRNRIVNEYASGNPFCPDSESLKIYKWIVDKVIEKDVFKIMSDSIVLRKKIEEY